MSDFPSRVPYSPYGKEFSTTPVEAEVLEDFAPVGFANNDPTLSFVRAVKQSGLMPVSYPRSMVDHDPVKLGPSMWEISPRHGRSFEVPKNQLDPATLGDISIKGSRLTNPYVELYLSDPPYYDLNGGMLQRDAVSAHNGSRLMHERGIDFGERILAIVSLRSMPTTEGIKPTAEAMRNYKRDLRGLPFNYDRDALSPVAVVRTMPNAYRLADLTRGVPDTEAIWNVLARSVNITAQQAPNLAGGLNPESRDDLATYLTKHMPVILGYSFGRLRAAGLRQKYPHTGNLSLSFSLPDADGINKTLRGPIDTYADRAATKGGAGIVQIAQKLDIYPYLSPFQKRGKVRELFKAFYASYYSGKKEKHPNELSI